MNKIIRFIIYYFKDQSGKGGGSSTTTVNIPAPTQEERDLQAAQLELTKQQLAEAQRQSDLFEKFSPMFEQQMATQADLAKQQLAAQQTAFSELTKALQPTETDLLNQQIENELLNRQLAYQSGQMPELTADEQSQLDELVSLQKQGVLENLLKSQTTGMQQAQDVSLARGLGSSSIRNSLEDEIRSSIMQQAGQAEQDIEGMKYNAAWQLPQAKQIFDTGMSQFQTALNAQAEANKQKLYGSLISNYQNPFEPLGTIFNMRVPGVYFGTQVDTSPKSSGTASDPWYKFDTKSSPTTQDYLNMIQRGSWRGNTVFDYTNGNYGTI